MQKIEVIAVFDTCGKFQPLRFRFQGEDSQLHRVDIDKVLSVQKVTYVGIESMIYLCRAQLEDRERVFELKYTVRSHDWELIRWVY